MPNEFVHYLLEGGTALTLLGFLIKFSMDFGSVKSSVETISTNHLPHIEKRIDDLTTMFVEHVDKQSKR